MRFIFRITGTWLLGMTLILIVMDGTKSLATNSIVLTSLKDAWLIVHAGSLNGFMQVFSEGSLQILWDVVLHHVLSWPGWLVIGVPGMMLLIIGRAEKHR
jgi:hypothetical protein